MVGAGGAAQAAAPTASTAPAAAPTTSAASEPSTAQAGPAAPKAPSSAPASSSPAETPHPVQPATTVEPLRITGPTSVIAGRPVRFAAVRPPRTMLAFSWDFEGSGRYSAPTGLPSTTHVFRRSGTFVISLLALAEHGGETVAHLQVVVLATHREAAHAHARVHRVRARTHAPVAPGASVTIKDFSFGPSTVTIHAGETLTWVNEGPSNHTATAAGVFNTGVLHSGQSASQLFPHAGTFSYRCSIHPFMRGTVTVLAASSSNATPSAAGAEAGSGGASGAPAPAAGASSGASTAPGPTLPNTGFSARGEIIAALAALALGTVLLLLSARRPRPRSGRPRG
jgi:plastocyanin